MFGVKNLARRLRRHDINFSQAEAINPRAKGLKDFVAETRKPRKKRSKKGGGTRFEFRARGDGTENSVKSRRFGTESFVERRYADELRNSSNAISVSR